MILDSLENRARYYALNPRLEKAFDYLLSTDLGALPAGRHAIDGDDVFINVMDVDLKRPADAKLEIHDRYLDIQVLVRGEREAFGWSQRDRVTRPLGAFDVHAYKERQYDLLADTVRAGLNMDFVYRVLRHEA